MTDYLSLEDTLLITEEMGLVVRDPGLLASAVARPGASAFGRDAYSTKSEKLAALIDGINRNDPLIDGNKRLSWVCAVVFARLNRINLVASQRDIVETITRVAAGEMRLHDLAVWLEEQSAGFPQ